MIVKKKPISLKIFQKMANPECNILFLRVYIQGHQTYTGKHKERKLKVPPEMKKKIQGSSR